MYFPIDRIFPFFISLIFFSAVTLAVFALASWLSLPFMLMCVLGGLVIAPITHGVLGTATNFTAKYFLRFAVVLLGLRIDFSDILVFGAQTALYLSLMVALAVIVGVAFIRFIRARDLGNNFAVLSGCAVGICGASAASAVAAILGTHKIPPHQLSIVILAVTLWGTLSLVLYPMILPLFDFNDLQQSFIIGAAIHDVAQVSAAGYAISPEVGDDAILVKLVRVFLLVPCLAILAIAQFTLGRKGAEQGSSLPWWRHIPFFVLGFLTLAALNGSGYIPISLSNGLGHFAQWSMALALVCVGARTNLKQALGAGLWPLLIIGGETILLLGGAILGAHLLDLSSLAG